MNKLIKKPSRTLLFFSALLLLHTSVASMRNNVPAELNQTSINGFFWPAFNNENQASGLEGSLYAPSYIDYGALRGDLPYSHGHPGPGQSYSRGCQSDYYCRGGHR